MRARNLVENISLKMLFVIVVLTWVVVLVVDVRRESFIVCDSPQQNII